MSEEYKADPALWAAAERNGTAHPMDMINLTLELRARVKQLEAAQNQPARAVTDPIWTDTPAPAGSLVERVAAAIADNDAPVDLWHDDARAAIREVAAWLRENHISGPANFIEQEAER
jgi:hypothetical protein